MTANAAETRTVGLPRALCLVQTSGAHEAGLSKHESLVGASSIRITIQCIRS